jgi:hypothetical protein
MPAARPSRRRPWVSATHRELGHGVADVGSDAPPGERTQIDYATMTADRQMRKGGPDHAQRALDVDPPHLFQFILALDGNENLGIDAGGVDNGVHTAPSRDCRVDPRNRAFGVLGVVAMRHQFLTLLEAAWIGSVRCQAGRRPRGERGRPS